MERYLLLLILGLSAAGGLGANENGAGESEQDATGDAAESEEEPSLVGIFSGLLETLTETASSTTCPGQCVHTIRAFMCEHVMDGANCPGSLKCCTEHPQAPPPRNMTFQPPMRHPPWRPPPNQGQYPMPPPGQRYPPNVQFVQQPPQGARPPPGQPIMQMQPPSNNREEVQSVPPQEEQVIHTTTMQPTTTAVQFVPTTQKPNVQTTTTTSPPKILPTNTQNGPTTHAWHNVSCPGVCVSSRMASSCEAVYKVPFACRNELQCCVTLDNFNGDKTTHLVRNEEESPEVLEDDEVDDEMQIQERRPNQPVRESQPPRENQPIRENQPVRDNYQPIRDNQQSFPPQSSEGAPAQCPGTCITSFFTFFCEQVLDFECPNQGKCCLTQEKGDEGPSGPMTPPRQEQPPPPQHCPRVCLPQHLVKACPKMLPFPCAQGFFCCIGPPLTQQNGPQGPQRPPPQSNRNPVPMTTTTTTTTTEAPEEMETAPWRPPCPGSCINTILAFTCFRNAEITDIFTCAKGGTKCCAPKTAIKEHLDALKGKDSEEKEENQKTGADFVSSEIPSVQNYLEGPGQFAGNPHGGPGTLRNEMVAQQEIMELVPSNPAPPLQQVPPPAQSSLIVLPQAKVQNSRSHYICGLKQGKPAHSRQKRVVGGSESQAGDWCWQVALINSLNQYLCGAALIGTQWVLTAAHCLTNIVRTGSTIYVRVGDHDLTSKYGSPSAQTLRVATTYIHHNHNSQTLDNDIALLKLQGQVELRQGVCLVCLPARGEGVRSGRRCTVTGYGYMGEAGPIPLRIREATLPIISDDDCIRQVNGVTEKRFVLPASSFCAGGEENKDACQGDGGGPLVCQDEGYYELTGLVSWGFGCGREDVPGVYVKVSSFIGWINQIISVNN